MKKFIGLVGVLVCLTSCTFGIDDSDPVRGVRLRIANYTETEFERFTLLVGYEGKDNFIAFDSLVSSEIIFAPGTEEDPSWREQKSFIGLKGFTKDGTWLVDNRVLEIGQEFFYIMKLENQPPFKSSTYIRGEGRNSLQIHMIGDGKNYFQKPI